MRTATCSPSIPWENLGSITAESTALGVTGRSVTTANATTATQIVKFRLSESHPRALLLRFRSDGSEDVDSVIDVLAARGADDYHRIATLTVVQGTQLDTGSVYFCDTITPANEDGLFDGEESNLANYIAHYYVRTLGFDRFLFQCTDLDTTTVYIDCAQLYD